MSEKFWMWLAASAFGVVMLVALVYALLITSECERQGGVMVRSMAASGWSCVQIPMRPDAPR